MFKRRGALRSRILPFVASEKITRLTLAVGLCLISHHIFDANAAMLLAGALALLMGILEAMAAGSGFTPIPENAELR